MQRKRRPIKRRQRRAWMTSDVADLRRRLGGGQRISRAARSIGRSVSSARYIAKRLRIPLRNIRPRWAKEEIRQVIRLKREEQTHIEIAARLGRSPESIRHKTRELRRRGVQI